MDAKDKDRVLFERDVLWVLYQLGACSTRPNKKKRERIICGIEE